MRRLFKVESHYYLRFQTVFTFSVIATLLYTTIGAASPCPFPSPFGVNDEIGASQTQTSEKALEAVSLIKDGRVIKLAHDYDEITIPTPFGREFDVDVLIGRGGKQEFRSGFFMGHLGQLGTQFDALGHAGTQEFGFYNCLSQAKVGPDDDGLLKKLGVETVKPFVTRGVLLDLVHHFSKEINGKEKRKGQILPASYIVTLEDIKQVLDEQGVDEPGPGDVVFFNTGWEAFFGDKQGNAQLGNAPGIGIEVAEWLADRGVALVGADTVAVEALTNFAGADAFPAGHLYENFPYPVHFVLITQNGIHLLELMRLSELVETALEKSKYQFAFIYTPVPIRGFAGSPGQPIAIY